MKIAFTGAQGVGKTTLLDILEKCFNYDELVKFIRNITRNTAKEAKYLNRQGDDSIQLALMEAHAIVMNSPYNFIMDRCVLDVFVYTYQLYQNKKVSESAFKECETMFKKYINDYDCLLYIRPEFPISGDEFRSGDVQYQWEIASLFDKIISDYQVPVIQLTGTIGDRLKKVLKIIGEYTHVSVS